MLRFKVIVEQSEEVQQLRNQVEDLKEQLRKKDQEIYRMGLMASLSIQYIDQLREAEAVLKQHGLDHSFINIRGSAG